MAQEIADSTLLDTWGSSGAKIEPDISKIIEGWQLGEQPPHEYMNWLQNTFGSKLNHILKNGVAKWNNETEYLAGSSVQHNSNVWICKTTNTNSEPTELNNNWDKMPSLENLALTVDTINDFPSSPTTGDVCIVKDLDIGGVFVYDSDKVADHNGGTNFNGWIRQYSGAVNVKWFGAKGDGVADDTVAIQSAFNYIKQIGGVLLFANGLVFRITDTIGNDSTNSNDYCDNVSIYGYGATIIIDNNTLGTNITALRLEGSNVHVKGLTITSTRSIDHTLDPSTLRTYYHNGIFIGGKYEQGFPAIGDSTYLRKDVSVEDCLIYNINRPLSIKRASNASANNNTIYNYTDTGLAIIDCIENINITNNTIYNGADDNIFCLHYDTSFYVNGTNNYVGNINIIGNSLSKSFGKNFGVGGYSDINFTNNICSDTWATSVGYENGDAASSSWSSRIIDNINLNVSSNTFKGSGTYYGASYNKTTAFPSVIETASISGQYASARSPYPWKNIVFKNNLIYGTETYGASFVNADGIHVEGNTFINTKSSGLVGVYVSGVSNITITSNMFRGVSFNFPYCYKLYNNSGTLTLAGVEIYGNTENYTTSPIDLTSSEQSSVNYISHRFAGYNGTITSYGNDISVSRYAFKSQGGNSNFNIYHRSGYSPYIFNTSGTGLNVCTDSAGASAGNFGISVPVSPAPEKLTVNGNVSAYSDNVNTCGTAARRWATIYAATGTINTSDDREKIYIDISDVEKQVALELKANMRKFKFTSSVKEKSEEKARIHFGSSAQTVKSIFEKHGLNAMNYAMICYDEWEAEYETKIIKESVTDNEGNILEEAETEQILVRAAGNRYGIRYEELLCFIIAAI